MKGLDVKTERLRATVRSAGSAAVAFSGGTDSTFLARIALDELGKSAVAVTVDSPLLAKKDLADSKALARRIGIRHVVLHVDPLSDDTFARNPPDRCYSCKRMIMRAVKEYARAHGLAEVFDGSNAEDAQDYRPGTKAKDEEGVESPLADLGLGKAEIRRASKRLGLPTHSKAPNPCLASRIPYGHEITIDKLRMIERAEDYLAGKGFSGVRVRAHGDVARIELSPQDIRRLLRSERSRAEIAKRLKKLGFAYVSVDIEGYRMGSMNEVLDR